MKVLIVDDVLMERAKLERIAAAAGHDVLVADAGEEGVALAITEQPDIIVMDVNMPELDGFAATRRLKADPRTRAIPVVFLTGENHKTDMAFGLMLGARGFVNKPYSDDDVLAQLES